MIPLISYLECLEAVIDSLNEEQQPHWTLDKIESLHIFGPVSLGLYHL